jgi:hypothetical protein
LASNGEPAQRRAHERELKEHTMSQRINLAGSNAGINAMQAVEGWVT